MVLDIVMIIILALLYNSHVAAMSFHEIAGLAVFGLFIIHCLLNIKWVIGVSKRFFSSSLTAKARISYIIDLLLLVTFILMIISGICTSQALFPSETHGSVWRSVHHFCGAVSIILVGIHLGLHFTFISGMVKKIIRIRSAVIRRIIAMFLLLIVLSFGGYSIKTSSFTGWLTEPFSVQTKGGEEQTADGKTEEKSGGDMNDHSGKEGEKKDGAVNGNSNEEKHDDSAKTTDVSPAVIFNTIAEFLSIMILFATLTYYIEKISIQIKRKKP